MWIAALFLGALLYSGTAAAFECAGMTLPSTLVICSDPELMRLADERQEAINEARGRIGEEAWPALWENQKVDQLSQKIRCHPIRWGGSGARHLHRRLPSSPAARVVWFDSPNGSNPFLPCMLTRW